MRKFAWLLTLLLVAGPVLATQLSEGTFEFTVPSGWTVKPFKGMKYKLAFGPVANKFAPNLNVMDEQSALSIDKYCQYNEGNLKKQIPSVKVKGKSRFNTAKGVQGVKLITASHQQNRDLVQTFYMFPGKGNLKFVVTCTTLADQAAKYGPQFDKSMKTFVVK